MINGEGTSGFTETAISLDLFDELLPSVDQKPEVTNASPEDLSDYSSCGESEFERYCSANSVMGTPSLCSSVGTFNDFLDLDFGSVKSLGVGEDRFLVSSSGDTGVSTSGKLDYLLDRGLEFQNENANRDSTGVRSLSSSNIQRWSKSQRNSEEESSSMFEATSSENRHGSAISSTGENGIEPPQSSNMRSFSTYDDNNSEGLSLLKDKKGSDLLPTFAENHTSEMLAVRHSEIKDSFDPFGFKESESLEDEDPSSKYIHSDDDGSMFNSGTDDEHRMESYNMRNLHCSQNSEINNKNPLVIGSAVAFGSEDWDDFMQENEESNLFFSPYDQLKDQQQKNLEREKTFSNSISMDTHPAPNIGQTEKVEMVRNSLVMGIANDLEYAGSPSTTDVYSQKMGLFVEKKTSLKGLNTMETAAKKQYQDIGNDKVVHSNVGDASENHSLRNLDQLVSLSNTSVVQCNLSTTKELSSKESVQFEGQSVHVLRSAIEEDLSIPVKTTKDYSPASADRSEYHLAPIKVGNLEPKEIYDELVLEMEEILLDSTETPGSRFPQSNKPLNHSRDGSSTASTSGTDDTYPHIQHPLKIDGVEVIGSKQKKGDVSLGERLVGVKEYTVYMIKVWSGTNQWEIERRYRDFFTLYRQLKKLYVNHGSSLPKPWFHVEQESRKIFGNSSPTIVNGRSALIQDCLRSILHSDTPNSVPGTLNSFLSPEKATLSTLNVPTFGKTVSLLVDIQPHKSLKQLLEAQHFVCAGCHKQLNTEKTLLMQTLGWGKPRLCEYTSQLFCALCHTNETAILPARVLHFWDFTDYQVSQMAKSYLDSIYDQPMLCVSAVNPFLFSKVPALLHVMDIRKKIGAMMPYVHCPFRMSVQRGVGSRRYLLEGNEFFALRDLVDLSKGVFAALPIMVETASKKITDHITQQCLVCCDSGVACGAKQACDDPSSLIFPFQENEVKRCKSCKSVFHKLCFEKLFNCPCGPSDLNRQTSNDSSGTSLVKKTESGVPGKFLSYLFAGKRQLGRRNRNPVILMGSLPSSFSDPL